MRWAGGKLCGLYVPRCFTDTCVFAFCLYMEQSIIFVKTVKLWILWKEFVHKMIMTDANELELKIDSLRIISVELKFAYQ
jgi:hypothetical protein